MKQINRYEYVNNYSFTPNITYKCNTVYEKNQSLIRRILNFFAKVYSCSEDSIPSQQFENYITEKEAAKLKATVNELDNSKYIYNMILQRYKVNNLNELTTEQYVDILNGINELIHIRYQ